MKMTTTTTTTAAHASAFNFSIFKSRKFSASNPLGRSLAREWREFNRLLDYAFSLERSRVTKPQREQPMDGGGGNIMPHNFKFKIQ
jgi:hypothetical protein